MDWKKMISELGEEVAGQLEDLVDAAQDDLKEYGVQIAKNLVVAVRSGRDDLKDELLEQGKVLAETQRVRLTSEAKAVLEVALQVAQRVLEVAL